MQKIYFSIKVLELGILVVASGLLLASCAMPYVTFIETLPKGQYLDANDNAAVKIKADTGVIVEENEKQRFAQTIREEIDAQKLHNVDSVDKREFELEILVKHYEKGNAFARFILDGLGQMHIEAKVSMFILPERKKFTEFYLNKTFARGGIAGGAASIKQVEQAFAIELAWIVTNVKG